MADVATAAGVSPMTVSRVINGDARVLPATRDKVQEAIGRLGYVPNPAARNLAGARQCRLVLLHTNPSAAYLSEFLLGSLASARKSDAELIVEQHDSGESPAALAARLAAHRVDGVLLPPPLCDDEALLASLASQRLEVAQVATGAPASTAHAVFIDDEAAAFAMTMHLLEQGHRRIGYVSGSPDQSASHLRRRGYKRALKDFGIDIEEVLIVPGDYTYRSGLEAAERLLNPSIRPTAIFAANDDMAAAIVGAAHRMALDVPGTLSVCGFDDTAIATATWPELTTIRQPVSAMAHRAITILANSIRRKDGSQSIAMQRVLLPFELVRRGSDARLEAGT
ncbi:Transcriptional regulator, LacI family [Sphingobium herbicidovorans NBRC 16415]|uniref:Transcriptional regulator, LacI family n=2 Tax=Sphingobium herbicidovorans TaxID=76947 RepID=A0A086P6N6_SPHHM|nr:Transcriptional regulator, LacI family [Sphingobium herbicidovorans NBRC 16415]